jgi:tetratricopeptide (TPR) repeat protein
MLENIFSRLKRQNSDSLVIELKLAARANPDDAETRVQLGLAYQNLGQLSKAIKAYLSALEIHPKFVTAYKNLGAAYDELGQFVDALKAYTKAIMLAPQDAELRNDLGLVYFNIGSYAEAIKAFRQALDIEPDNGRAHFCLGLVYLDLGDIKMALMEHGQIDSHRDPHLADELMDKIHLQSSKPQELHREM